MKRQVSLNNNSFDRAGITKDCKDAICEYIWNGFEAGATAVSVKLNGASLKEAMSIEVSDNGTGIPYDNLDETFGAFLSSIKNESTIRIKSQTNKGKGRFSYLCFSSSAEWTTTFSQNGIKKTYKIRTDSISKSEYDPTDPQETSGPVGTSVDFPLFESAIVDNFTYSNMRQKLLEEFSWFLYLNKSKNMSLEYMGTTLDVSQYINTELSKNNIETIEGQTFDINIVVWKNNVSNTSKIYYLTTSGEIISTQNTSFNKNTVGFYHAVFVSSGYFKSGMFLPTEDDGEQTTMGSNDNTRDIFRQLKKKISILVAGVLKSFLIFQADRQLADMEDRGTLPSFADDEYSQLRKKDFETVTRELYCVEPRIFYKLNETQEKSLLGLLNLLLSSDERENVLQIIEQVVSLTSEQREDFAGILQRSKLQYIVDAVGTIERRVAVAEQLKKIVFDLTKFANERDHVQKIIEQHFWLFGEQYHLLTADKNLQTPLQEYEKLTESPAYDGTQVLTKEQSAQRIDIFLYSKRLQEDKSSEMLIIELKAPYIKLSLDVYNQIVRYAIVLLEINFAVC